MSVLRGPFLQQWSLNIWACENIVYYHCCSFRSAEKTFQNRPHHVCESQLQRFTGNKFTRNPSYLNFLELFITLDHQHIGNTTVSIVLSFLSEFSSWSTTKWGIYFRFSFSVYNIFSLWALFLTHNFLQKSCQRTLLRYLYLNLTRHLVIPTLKSRNSIFFVRWTSIAKLLFDVWNNK